MARFRLLWLTVRGSLWFVPALAVAGALGLAVALIDLEGRLGYAFAEHLPRLFGSGAEGARSMLEVVAGSAVTIAGVAFSITIVALSLASQQYSSRVLRNFMADRANQAVLGVLAGVFAYCMAVLRTIRGDPTPYVPSLAVVGGVLLAFVALGAFIFYIHHIALSIQASHILAMVSRDTFAAIDVLFPEPLADDGREPPATARHDVAWRAIGAPRSGVIQSVDETRLARFARRRDTALRMERSAGEFVVEGRPLVSVDAAAAIDAADVAALQACVAIGRERTAEQDAGYGVRQLVDVALKALSPGINDPTTAIAAIDWLTAVLARLAVRRLAPAHRVEDGRAVVEVRGITFGRLVDEAFEEIRHAGRSNPVVMGRLLDALDTLEQVTRGPDRRAALARHVRRVRETAGRGVEAPFAWEPLDSRATDLLQRLTADQGTAAR